MRAVHDCGDADTAHKMRHSCDPQGFPVRPSNLLKTLANEPGSTHDRPGPQQANLTTPASRSSRNPAAPPLEPPNLLQAFADPMSLLLAKWSCRRVRKCHHRQVRLQLPIIRASRERRHRRKLFVRSQNRMRPKLGKSPHPAILRRDPTGPPAYVSLTKHRTPDCRSK